MRKVTTTERYDATGELIERTVITEEIEEGEEDEQ